MVDQLKVIKEEPNRDLIKVLEGMIKQAESGELQGIIFAKMLPTGTVHGWMGVQRHRAPALIGEMYMLMTELTNEIDGIDSRIIK